MVISAFSLAAVTLLSSCHIFPEKASMDDVRLKPLRFAMGKEDWTVRGFTQLPNAADVRIETPPVWEKKSYDVMLHISAASSRTIAFSKYGDGYRCIGEQEIHEGPNTYTTVDGTFRERICVTYETVPVSGYPLNQTNVTYEGDDPALNGHYLSLSEVRPIIRKWDKANTHSR
jgi:hypothetical protein